MPHFVVTDHEDQRVVLVAAVANSTVARRRYFENAGLTDEEIDELEEGGFEGIFATKLGKADLKRGNVVEIWG